MLILRYKLNNINPSSSAANTPKNGKKQRVNTPVSTPIKYLIGTNKYNITRTSNDGSM